MATINNSRQRDSIIHFLASRKDHPTANTIYLNVREEFPHISLGTVYRNLSLLSDLGEITRINIGDGSDRYDYDTSLHHHFVCKDCSGVFDLEMADISGIMESAQKNFPGRIDHYHMYFTGLCESCLKKSKQDNHQNIV